MCAEWRIVTGGVGRWGRPVRRGSRLRRDPRGDRRTVPGRRLERAGHPRAERRRAERHPIELRVLDDHGHVSEGSGENVFIVRDGTLITPGHTSSILDGITRNAIIQIANDLGYRVEERAIARAELYLADEAFLTGTAAELVPIREVDDHPLGEPGEVTRVIGAKFEDALHGRAEEYHEWLDFVEAPAGVDEPDKVGS